MTFAIKVGGGKLAKVWKSLLRFVVHVLPFPLHQPFNSVGLCTPKKFKTTPKDIQDTFKESLHLKSIFSPRVCFGHTHSNYGLLKT